MKKDSISLKTATKRTPEESRIALLNMLEDIAKEKKELEKKTRELRKEKRRVEKSKKEIEVLGKKAEERRIAAFNILQDVEEARKRLKKSFQELKVLDKLKDEFVNIGAHELKTPLTPIIGYLDLILKKKNSKISKEERKYLEICLENANRLNNLTTDISDISKLETKAMKFEMKPVKIEKIVNDVIESLKLAAQEKHLELKVNIQPKLPSINGDSQRLIQAFSKLVENAIKFTDEGKINVSAEKQRNKILVKVSDTGMGIDKKDIPKLFTKFFQAQDITTRKTKGTGLGLVISKRIVEAHGGKIWADSEGKDKGSTFSFTLPLGDRKKKKVTVGNHFKEAKKAREKAKAVLGFDDKELLRKPKEKKEKSEEDDEFYLQEALKFQKEAKELKEKLAKEKK